MRIETQATDILDVHSELNHDYFELVWPGTKLPLN